MTKLILIRVKKKKLKLIVIGSFSLDNFIKYLGSYVGDDPLGTISSANIANVLEKARTYVVGTAHGQGTGYPETWKDQPFSTGFGLTQIWKTALAMDNTTRATVLKYEPNEFARIWREKLIEHKWDIETSLLFGSQTSVDSVQYIRNHDVNISRNKTKNY